MKCSDEKVMVMVMYGCKMYGGLQRGNVEHTVVRRTSPKLQQQEYVAKSEDNLRSQTYSATIEAQIAQVLLSLMDMQ